jgi:hypothetical protein
MVEPLFEMRKRWSVYGAERLQSRVVMATSACKQSLRLEALSASGMGRKAHDSMSWLEART